MALSLHFDREPARSSPMSRLRAGLVRAEALHRPCCDRDHEIGGCALPSAHRRRLPPFSFGPPHPERPLEHRAAGTVANFGFKSGTRIIAFSVSFSISKFAQMSRQMLANF